MNRKKRMVTMFSSKDGALISRKQDRNALCKCGSGKKAKNCCGCETEYFKPKVKRPNSAEIPDGIVLKVE